MALWFPCKGWNLYGWTNKLFYPITVSSFIGHPSIFFETSFHLVLPDFAMARLHTPSVELFY